MEGVRLEGWMEDQTGGSDRGSDWGDRIGGVGLRGLDSGGRTQRRKWGQTGRTGFSVNISLKGLRGGDKITKFSKFWYNF